MQKINWILLSGFLFYTRFVNLGWGLPYPMHPDERNMALAIQVLNFRDSFNPHFFAYGQFPLYLGYIGVMIMKFFDGDLGTPVSFPEAAFSLRIISALASIITVFVLIKIIKALKLFEKKYVLLLIFSPVLIQFAHFGTTESLLILFYSVIIYLSLLLIQKKIPHSKFLILNSLFCGLALATKISSMIFLVLPIFTLTTCVVRSYTRLRLAGKVVLLTICFALLFSPHTLISFNEFSGSIQYESAVALGQIKVFYTRQFEHTIPVSFQFAKIFPYTLGWPVFLLGSLGILFLSWKKKEFNLFRIALLIVFVPNAFMFAKWTRFMAPVFPLFILFAIVFLSQIKVSRFILYTLCFISVIPGIAYLSLYQNPDVRIQATKWINHTVPDGSQILSETANVVDIPLDNRTNNLVSFNFYDLDKEVNLQRELSYLISNAEYIIVPSRRIFKNHQSREYPILNEYYQRLFSGELGFREVAEFHSYPKLFVEFPDEDAEETWTVFDHPVIRIYKRI